MVQNLCDLVKFVRHHQMACFMWAIHTPSIKYLQEREDVMTLPHQA
jgi:hypothetical protein